MKQKQHVARPMQPFSRNAHKKEENVFQPVDDVNAAGFVNLANESEEGMPVILNVFSLSDSFTKRMEESETHENNFLATPPNSPSFEKFELLKDKSVVRENCGSYKRNLPFRYDSEYWSTSARVDYSTIVTPQVHDIKYKSIDQVTSRPQTITNGFIDRPRQYRYRRKLTIKDQPSNNAVHDMTVDQNLYFTNTNNISFPNVRSHAFHMDKYLAQSRSLVSQGSAVCANMKAEKGNYISKEKKPAKRQHVFIKRKLLQHRQRKCVTKSKSLSDVKKPIDTEHIKSHCVPNPNDKDLQLCGDNELKQTLNTKNKKIQDSKKCVNISLTKELPYITTETLRESKNDTEDDDEFLSPREIKVLQLRKRLQEQELLLKRLRTNH